MLAIPFSLVVRSYEFPFIVKTIIWSIIGTPFLSFNKAVKLVPFLKYKSISVDIISVSNLEASLGISFDSVLMLLISKFRSFEDITSSDFIKSVDSLKSFAEIAVMDKIPIKSIAAKNDIFL